MPAYFALGFIGLLAVLYLLNWVSRLDPAALATVLRYIAIALAIAGLILVIIAGRIGLLLMLASLGYPLWRRWKASREAARIGQPQGQRSGVDTAYLSVSLDHDTGAVDGRVKMGRFKDRRLADLGLPELLSLLDDLRREDPEGVAVLEAYIDRIHGPAWRGAEGTEDSGKSGADPQSGSRPAMTRAEALAMLGLAATASAADIRDAHRRLMMRLHPDHGGSDYLAARLNEARDLLLRS
jgi:hypothetical protein